MVRNFTLLIILPALIACGCAANPQACDHVTLLPTADGAQGNVCRFLADAGVPCNEREGLAVVANTPECRAALVRILQIDRVRMDVIASNLMNQNTTNDAAGNNNPYRRKIVVVRDGKYEIQTETDSPPFLLKHEPGHPLADAKGYVKYPNIDPAIEKINALLAEREYDVASEMLRRMDPTVIGETSRRPGGAE